MKQVISYVANDGKIFDTEEECRLYENNISINAIDKVFFFDENLKQIFLSRNLNSPFSDILCDSFFIVVKDMEQWERFIELLERYYINYYEHLIEIVTEPGIYFYCEEKEDWISLKEEKSHLEMIEKKLGNF